MRPKVDSLMRETNSTNGKECAAEKPPSYGRVFTDWLINHLFKQTNELSRPTYKFDKIVRSRGKGNAFIIVIRRILCTAYSDGEKSLRS